MVGARRQPLTTSSRPKRAATLKKEAEKEDDAKSKVSKEKDKLSGGSSKVTSPDEKVIYCSNV